MVISIPHCLKQYIRHISLCLTYYPLVFYSASIHLEDEDRGLAPAVPAPR